NARSTSKLLSPVPVQTIVKKPFGVGKNDVLVCWVDATPGRIAVLIGDSYRTFKISENTDNNFAEAVALELVALLLVSRNHVGDVHIYSDSDTALQTFEGKKCSLKSVTEVSARTRRILASAKFNFKLIKVETKKNQADALSRGRNPAGYSVITWPVVIPKALARRVFAE
ncbi:hypothetical protein FRC07_009642, partial [Ceratobasidium sp. 392]